MRINSQQMLSGMQPKMRAKFKVSFQSGNRRAAEQSSDELTDDSEGSSCPSFLSACCIHALQHCLARACICLTNPLCWWTLTQHEVLLAACCLQLAALLSSAFMLRLTAACLGTSALDCCCKLQSNRCLAALPALGLRVRLLRIFTDPSIPQSRI